MNQCLLVEDDYVYALKTKLLLQEIGVNVPFIAKNFDEINSALDKQSYDLILSDVHLNDQEFTFEYYKNKKDLPPIVYYSAYSEESFYSKSKLTNPYVYLVKPFNKISLFSAVHGALKQKNIEPKHNQEEEETPIFIRNNGNLTPVYISKIKFIKSEGNYCIFKIDEGEIVIRSSIKTILEKLNNELLVQNHRAYVVNISKIDNVVISKNEITVGQDVLPIGRKYKKELLRKMQNN